MKKLGILITAIAIVALAATGAMAALINTNHNVVAHDNLSGATAQQGACSFCHVPHGAAGVGLFPSGLGAVSGGGSAWEGDAIAQMCWDCHGDMVTPSPATQQIVPFQGVLDGAHGRDATLLVTGTLGWGDITGADPDPALAGIYGYDAATDRIGCQSCHNPHDNVQRPFLRDNAIGEAVAEGNFLTLCNDCHINRAATSTSDAVGGSRQNHPTDNRALADTVASSLYQFGVAGYSIRFDSTWASLAVEITSVAAGNDVEHWNLGGKFVQGSAGGINCATCHMTHSNEVDETAYAVGDGLAGNQVGALPVGWGYNFLLALDSNPAAGAIAAVCAGCHDIVADPAAGPGAATTYSHPYQSAAPWGVSVDIVAMANSYGAKWGGVAPNETIVCQSCHDMHFARLSDLASTDTYSLQRVYCEDCHDAASSKTGHHPSGIDVTWTGTTPELRDDGAGGPPEIGSDVTWNAVDRADVQSASVVDWTSSNTPYRFATSAVEDGVMSCATCHFSGAHNNATAFPGVVGDAAEATMCVDCHGLNPSVYTAQVGGLEQDGTHFLGPVTVTGYKWGNETGAVDSVTPAAGAGAAFYGTGGELICTSCHLIKTDTYIVQTANNVGDNEAGTKDTIGMMLSPSGNAVDDGGGATNTVTGDFLCTDCHGAAPGANTTHPVQPETTGAMSAATLPNATVADNGVTPTATSGINCESCHRAHDASTAWWAGKLASDGHYILEANVPVLGGAGAEYVNEQVLCSSCHLK
ncbi:MAG: cytochrome c3 family protein [bacterium]|nr:cytochrome c3 family protein [bacterium]